MGLVGFTGLLPHPPIIVPAVGRARLEDCRATVDACRDFAARLVATEPDRLFVVSPHSPRRHGAFGLRQGGRLRGDLGRFGAPDAAIDLPTDGEFGEALERKLGESGLRTWSMPPISLDHGAVVPLFFLAEAGWTGPTILASVPWSAEPATFSAFGRALRLAVEQLPGTTALLASGDMSHKCTPGAPAGFHPRAVEFDRVLTEAIARGELGDIARIDPELRELAAEDAADTALLVASALESKEQDPRVLSYEHPFGVGYLVAIFGAGHRARDPV